MPHPVRRPFPTEIVVAVIAMISSVAVAYITTRSTITSNKERIDKTTEKATELELRFSTIQVPAGTIVAYGGPEVPKGWLICNGDPVGKNDYPALWNAIGISWGVGNGVTTFNVPDLRGVFLRGVNGGRNDDYADPDRDNRKAVLSSGNTVGTFQADAFKSHTHPAGPYVYTHPEGTIPKGGHYGFNSGDAPNTGSTGGNETRPKNAYVHWIIKT